MNPTTPHHDRQLAARASDGAGDPGESPSPSSLTAARGSRSPRASSSRSFTAVQAKFGYLNSAHLDAVAQLLQVPAAKVAGVASFYHFFRLQPRGKYIINVCLGTACYVKGSDRIAQRVIDELGITWGETSKDGIFTLEQSRCLGTCGLAPRHHDRRPDPWPGHPRPGPGDPGEVSQEGPIGNVTMLLGFGEIMLRVTPPGFLRFRQSLPGALDCSFGGGRGQRVCFAGPARPAHPAVDGPCPSTRWPTASWDGCETSGSIRSTSCDATPAAWVSTFSKPAPTSAGSAVIYDRDQSAIGLTAPDEYDFEGATRGRHATARHWHHARPERKRLSVDPGLGSVGPAEKHSGLL